MSKNVSSPVHVAAMRHSLPELIQAIERGEAVDALDREGRTPLFYAVMDGDLGITAELIRRGANPAAQDRGFETPLHFAAREYRNDVAELLLKSGASVDAQDGHGNTPLLRAVFESRGRGQLIGLLRAHGADKTLKNEHGVSSDDLATSIGNYDVRQFLAG